MPEEVHRLGHDFPRGHVLFRDGDVGREMYVVQSGKVRISKLVRDVDKTLVVLGTGEFFGEMSILNNATRSATATISEDARLLVIDPKMFESMVRGNAEIAVRMIKKFASRLQEADEQIENLLLRDANSRVVHALSHLASREAARQNLAAGLTVKVPMTAKDLAGRVGLETGMVEQVLQRLLQGKLVETTEQSLIVHNPARLKDFLGFLEMKEKFGDITL
jgi:CRP/FNR family cyclic AMP-dependent transcriptional regulator